MRRTIPGSPPVPHIALYRKYRSQTFEDLVGQHHITRTLQAAIESGRIAHAFLFVGPRGTGKTSTARIFAKALNCEHGPTPTPCGVCRLCTAIASGSGADVIELDAASESGVNEVRELIESANYTPMEGRYKVYIIDEVHDLSGKAFDAFLKTIEEPPAHVIFILATTELNKVPLTIRSRCQRYEFHRGSIKEIVARLKHVCEQEEIQAAPSALNVIARMADGGYRDALTLLEQVVLTSPEGLTYETVMRQTGLIEEEQVDNLLRSAAAGDTATLIATADETVRMGKEPRAIIESLLLRLSELTHLAHGLDTDAFEPERRKAADQLIEQIGKDNILSFRAALAEEHREIRDATLPRLWLELALLKLTKPKVAAGREPEAAPAPPARAPTSSEVPQPARKEPVAPPKPAKKVEPIVDPELEDIRLRWRDAVELLKERFRAAGKMIDSAEVSAFEGKTAIVMFAKPFQFERMQANRKAQEAVLLGFQEAMGDTEWTLRFECAVKEEDASDAAVQLPVEGEQLARIVEEVFEVKPE